MGTRKSGTAEIGDRHFFLPEKKVPVPDFCRPRFPRPQFPLLLLVFICIIGYPISSKSQDADQDSAEISQPLNSTLQRLFYKIYFNHRVNGRLHNSAQAGQNFSDIIGQFISRSHIQSLLGTARPLHGRDLDMSNFVVYYSIYEVEDPRLFQQLMELMREGVSIVLVTDGDNATFFKPASERIRRQWTDAQRAFYLTRYDKNRDGVVDQHDVEDIDARSYLMKTWIRRLKREFATHLRNNARLDVHPHQELKVVTSPFKHTPPEGMLYLPLHHSKEIIIALKKYTERDAELIPLKGLLGSGNHTFSCMNGDMRPDVKALLNQPRHFLRHTITPDDFVAQSMGNVNFLMEISDRHILDFFLHRDILDSIEQYENGRMFRPVDGESPPPYRSFQLKDGSEVRVGVTQGRPKRSPLGDIDPSTGFDPNTWIVDFLQDSKQNIHTIDEIVNTEYVYSHVGIHRQLQAAIKKYRPQFSGQYDYMAAFLPYSNVASLAGITQLSSAKGRSPVGLSTSEDTPDALSELSRRVQFSESPYGLLSDGLGEIKIYANPYDKLHLKLMMFQYQYKDPAFDKPQTRYRIFLGSLNRTANGANNREIFFSIDSADASLFRTLKTYVSAIEKQSHAIPFEVEYTRFLLRSLFRLPPMLQPLNPEEKPAWEHTLTPQRINRIIAALKLKNSERSARRLKEELKALSLDLEPHSAFAGSDAFESTLALIDLFFKKSSMSRQKAKERWLVLSFLASAHTQSISTDSVVQMANRFFGDNLSLRKPLMDLLTRLVPDHSLFSTILLRGHFIPADVSSHWLDPHTMLYPTHRVAQHHRLTRAVIESTFPSPDTRALIKMLEKSAPRRSHAYLARLVRLFEKFPHNAKTAHTLFTLFKLFDNPEALMNATTLKNKIQLIADQNNITSTHIKKLITLFEAFRKAAQKRGLTLPHLNCS